MNTTTETVCVSYFQPGDARHWIPSGLATVDLQINCEELEDDYAAAVESAAEQWCEEYHGKGSFFGVILDP